MFDSRRIGLAFVICAASACSYAQTSLPTQCLKSFPVKDKPFSSGQQTMSCVQTELRRGELFVKINSLGETGEIDGATLAKDLAAVEARLAKEEASNNWVGLTGAITGNFLATIGLSACLETAGAGCAVTAVGKILAIVGVIDSATSESDKASSASSLRKEIESIRKKNQGKKSSSKALRDRMVSDFTQLCDEVQKQCL
jgi:hypothetical protein